MAIDPAGSTAAEPTIHKAQRATDGSGAVEWWDQLDMHQAIQRRKQDLDIVVRGPDKKRNKAKAKEIEAGVGPWKFHVWHARPGSLARCHTSSRIRHRQKATPFMRSIHGKPGKNHEIYDLRPSRANPIQ
jgi:hypothetical protein